MQATARPLSDVFDCLAEALQDLDDHGEAMAALHLAMAVDCLRASLEPGDSGSGWGDGLRPKLRLVASS